MQSNFIEITLRHGCSPVNLLHIFRTPFPKNTSGGLLLRVACHLALKIMKNILSFKTLPNSLRNSTALQCRSTKTILYGSETMSHPVPKI